MEYEIDGNIFPTLEIQLTRRGIGIHRIRGHGLDEPGH